MHWSDGYCAKLPSDTFTRLTPLWHYEKIGDLVRCCVRLPINSPLKREIVGPLTKLHSMARRLSALEMCKALFDIRELDEELQPVGKESFLAQEQANLGLHEDDDNNEGEEEHLEGNLEHRPGTTKRRQYYYKKVADALMECRPEPGQHAYLYHIKLRLSCPLPEEQNTRGRKIYPPEESPRGFGILTLKPIPEICPFPIFTRSGEVSVSLELSPNKVTLSSEQCEKVVAFLNYTFSSVLRLQKHLMIFGPESAENSYYIVPITNKPAATVDWNFVDLIWEQKDAVPNPVPEKERRNFKFDPTKYQDAVVMPWYRNQDQPQYFYVAEICSHLSPKSQFPGGEYNTFEEYYYAKYGLKVQCLSQPLLDVDHTSARLNFLTPRYVNRKGVALPVSSEHTKRNKRENLEQKQILVAELCALHPFPASLWRQAVSLPCILYRINGLLLADELRCKVAHDIGLGIQHLSPDSNISTSKNTLSTMNCAVNANALDSSSHNTVEGNESIQLLNKSRDNKFSSDIGTELIIRPDVELKDNADSEHGTPFGKCLPDQKSSDVIQGNQNVNSAGVIAPLATSDSGITFSFDKQPDLQSHPGPSPSIILQALTMSNANDGINLERLETIGDSFLKYAITTYLYCTHENIHEGKLSHLRSKQVSNLQLYRLGRDKQLGRSMIATKFEPHDNWLPPCYFVPWKLEKALIKAGVPPGMWNRQELASLRLMDNDTIDKLVWERRNEILSVNAEVHDNSEHLLPFVPYNLLTQHSIPDKSLADCVEALIGAYLIACGPRGALLFMSWLGIKVLPAHTERSNTRQYGWLAPPPSPLLRNVPDPDGELNRMLNGFDQFEERLKYRFRDRAYLLQAMSHASFSPNRLTDCYQRLEFLGDAVLDYLITRYLYEDVRQHSPGALTDLRSALVNNAIFAVLAVRHGFHQFFLHLSPGLAQVIQRFVRLQQANNHCLSPQANNDCSEAEDIEVPKALGDVFESVAGAIFLDSGMSLDAVWRTYHAMMAPELELFSAHVPKSPIRELLEREPETAKFG
ncbi:hypothetical protein B566_EDAN015061 [Ephemera danica]|nr:hypothetical protein B566_EDAN015061 [Ephemera danica]